MASCHVHGIRELQKYLHADSFVLGGINARTKLLFKRPSGPIFGIFASSTTPSKGPWLLTLKLMTNECKAF
jgi:hypothetical protein